MGKLEGKIACITGGTRSIGRAMAEAFLAEGATVATQQKVLSLLPKWVADQILLFMQVTHQSSPLLKV